MNKQPFTTLQLFLTVSVSMAIFSPLATFCLLWVKGLPDFAAPHHVFYWSYQHAGWSSILSGLLLSLFLLMIRRWWGKTTRPYDFGRSFSIGACFGAAAQGLATVIYRSVMGKSFSSFLVSAALMAGAIVGSIIVSFVFRRISNDPIVPWRHS